MASKKSDYEEVQPLANSGAGPTATSGKRSPIPIPAAPPRKPEPEFVGEEPAALAEPKPPVPKLPEAEYCASVIPGPKVALPGWMADPLKRLAKRLQMPLWLVVQHGPAKPYGTISPETYDLLFAQRRHIKPDLPVALLIHSPGGDAHESFKLARLFQRRAQKLTAIVPLYAKSAATLLALAASEIMLGTDAELGPLDVQIYDPEREEMGSALDNVQALERLTAFSLTAFDQYMYLLRRRSQKKSGTLVPIAAEYASSLVRPLLERINAREYTKMSRNLKIAEQYASSLLKADGGDANGAQGIASALVANYPTHRFVIDADEARALGLPIVDPPAELDEVVDMICRLEKDKTAVLGLFCPVQGEDDHEASAEATECG